MADIKKQVITLDKPQIIKVKLDTDEVSHLEAYAADAPLTVSCACLSDYHED